MNTSSWQPSVLVTCLVLSRAGDKHETLIVGTVRLGIVCTIGIVEEFNLLCRFLNQKTWGTVHGRGVLAVFPRFFELSMLP